MNWGIYLKYNNLADGSVEYPLDGGVFNEVFSPSETTFGWVIIVLITALIFFAFSWIIKNFVATRIKSRQSRAQFKKWFYLLKLVVWVSFILVGLYTLLIINLLVFSILISFSIFFLHKTIKDFIYGVLFRLKNVFNVGDKISLADISGEIKSIRSFALELSNEDNDIIYLPYSKIHGETLVKQHIRGKVQSMTIYLVVREELHDQVLKNGSKWLISCPWIVGRAAISVKKSEMNKLSFSFQTVNVEFKSKVEEFLIRKIKTLN